MANLLSNTTIGGYQSIHTGNIGSYALTSVPANVITTSGGQTIAGTTYFSGGESLNVYGIRGRFTNEYIHLYNKVGIGHPSGWGQGEGNTPVYGLSTYGGINIAYGYDGAATINTYTRINKNWGGGDYGTEAFTIRGTYPSITLRSTNHDSKWLIHHASELQFYYGASADTNVWSNVLSITTNGNLYMAWAGGYISDLLNAKQNASTAITTSNIGSQSVTNSAQLNGLSKIQLWNNSGQGHSTYQTFGAIPNFGVWFMQASGAADTPQAGSQYYVQTQGLGNDYAYGDYALMTAVARDHARKYTYYRTREGGSWGSWSKGAAGYADEAAVLSSMNISQFTNNSGYLTGITSGQVTGALGYTPYNSSNPSGYVNNAFAGAMNQDVRTTDAPTFDYINTTMPNKSFNPFGGAKMHDAVLTNMMAGKWDRFDVTINGVLEPNAAFHLSNQNYEEYNSANLYGTDAGETKVYNINFQKLEGYFNSNGVTYSSGFFDLNFYSSPFPASWSCRAKNRDGVWTNVTLTKIGSSLLRGVSPYGNWLTDIEYTLTARTGAPYVTGNITYGISEFEFFGSRIALSQGAVISAVGGYMSGVLSTKNGNSDNWNTTYSWGNHASAGYQAASTAITTSNIGSQSVSYATTAGALTSMNISQFTNNSGYLTSLPSHNHDDRYYTETESDARYIQYGSITSTFGLNDNKLYLRTNGDNNHYIWNAADDWEELVYYTGTGFRVKGSTGTVSATFTDSGISIGTSSTLIRSFDAQG